MTGCDAFSGISSRVLRNRPVIPVFASRTRHRVQPVTRVFVVNWRAETQPGEESCRFVSSLPKSALLYSARECLLREWPFTRALGPSLVRFIERPGAHRNAILDDAPVGQEVREVVHVVLVAGCRGPH